MEKQVVAVSPSWGSKINWTQLASVIATLFVWLGVPLTAEQALTVIVAISIASDLLTVVWRTWFTGTAPTTTQVEVMAADKGLVAVAPAETKNPAAATATIKKAKRNFNN